MKTALSMVKTNLKHTGTVYSIIIPVMILVVINYLTSIILVSSSENYTLGGGNYLYLLPILLAIFVPAQNFSKLMNLGGKRKDFFRSSILTYVIASGIAILLHILIYFTIDLFLQTKIAGVIDLFNVFGFMEHGVIIAFFQMLAFLILVCCVLHTLTMIQGHWYGWVTNAVIVIIISVFIPIAPLRAVLVWFFNLIIFHNTVIIQIISCLVLAAIIYYASLIPIRSKRI